MPGVIPPARSPRDAPAADIGSANRSEIAPLSTWREVWAALAWSLASLFAFVAAAFSIYLGWLAFEGVELGAWGSPEVWRRQPPKVIVHLIAACAGAGAVILAAAYRSRTSVADYLALVRPRGRAAEVVLASVAAFAVAMLMVYGLAFALDIEYVSSWPKTLTWLTVVRWIDRAVVVPVWEELLFRGLMYRGLAQSRLGTWGAIGVTTVLFALVHFAAEPWDWLRLFNVTVMGLTLGWLRAHTASLLPPIVVHAIWNGWRGIVAVIVP
jgi:membrane protease YdiL (CAAX protease family)